MLNGQPDSPFYDDMNLMLPRDRREMTAWNRHYYSTHPLIHNWIEEVVGQVCCGFNLTAMDDCNNNELRIYKDAFFDKKGNFRHNSTLRDMTKELNIIGETIPYVEVDEKNGTFDIALHNPDFVNIKKNLDGNSMSLVPDDNLVKLVNSKEKKDIDLTKTIDKEVVRHVRARKDIPLSPILVSHLAMMGSPYDLRGTSRIVKYLKSLLVDDKLREMAFENNINYVVSKDLVESMRAECESESFKHSLQNQRNMLEEFLINKIFKPFQRLHSIKGSVGISWTSPIDTDNFKFLFKN
jgi:hypothetical protein